MEHSRRAFSGIQSKLEAELESIGWAAEDLHSLHWNKVIMEVTSAQALKAFEKPHTFPHLYNGVAHTSALMRKFRVCHVEVVDDNANRVAKEIAVSVTKDRRFQSYVARGGPSWLANIIQADASCSITSVRAWGSRLSCQLVLLQAVYFITSSSFFGLRISLFSSTPTGVLVVLSFIWFPNHLSWITICWFYIFNDKKKTNHLSRTQV